VTAKAPDVRFVTFAPCGCGESDDEALMHRCSACDQHSHEGCYGDWNKRCTHCGISAEQVRLMFTESD